MLDFRRGYSLAVIADADLQPLSRRPDGEAQSTGLGRGLQSVLHCILYQRVKRERRDEKAFIR